MTLHRQHLVDKSSSSEEESKAGLLGFKLKSKIDKKLWHQLVPKEDDTLIDMPRLL